MNKRNLEKPSDCPKAKNRKILSEAIKLTTTNRGFRTINHMVATNEQTKKELSYFYRKRQVQGDGKHTKPLNLYITDSVAEPISVLINELW